MLFGLAVAVGATAAVLWVNAIRTPRVVPLPIRFAQLQSPHSGMLQIAEAVGYFAQEGVTATVLVTPTGYHAIQAVLKGEADVAGSAVPPIARILDEGHRLKIIATIYTATANAGIVARRDRGIVHAADLKGKRVGFIFGTATHYMLETFLAYHGVRLEDVTFVPLEVSQMVNAMDEHNLDAVSTWNPYFSQIRRALGAAATVFSSDEIYAETYSLVVREDFVARNPEQVSRMLRALLKAEAFIRSEPDQAFQIIATHSKTDASLLRGPGNERVYQLTLGQSLLLATENTVEWYFRRGLVPTGPVPDVLEAFDTDPLAAVKPTGVSIVK